MQNRVHGRPCSFCSATHRFGQALPSTLRCRDLAGGLTFKDHTFSSVVAYDVEWRRKGGGLYPASAPERMAPYAASGGAIGPDGWLYLLGHDRLEMCVVGRPPMGPALIHIATVDLEVEGQASPAVASSKGGSGKD